VKNPTQRVKWSVSTKKYGYITSYGKMNGACDIYTQCDKSGSFTVTAQMGHKKLKCKVKVKNKNNSTATESTAVEDVSVNFNTLKEKLLSDGTLSSKGKYEFAKVSYDDDGTEYYDNINYSPSTNKMQFAEGIETDGSYAILLMEFDLSDTDSASVAISATSSSDNITRTGVGTIYPQDVMSSADVEFTKYDFDGLKLQNTLDEGGQILFDSGMKYWNKLLKNHNTGLKMENLGFSLYEYDE
jgi:hypothetical protein